METKAFRIERLSSGSKAAINTAFLIRFGIIFMHARQKVLEQKLADPNLYADHNKEKLKALLLEKAEVDSRCETLEMDWLEASEQLEILHTGGKAG